MLDLREMEILHLDFYVPTENYSPYGLCKGFQCLDSRYPPPTKSTPSATLCPLKFQLLSEEDFHLYRQLKNDHKVRYFEINQNCSQTRALSLLIARRVKLFRLSWGWKSALSELATIPRLFWRPSHLSQLREPTALHRKLREREIIIDFHGMSLFKGISRVPRHMLRRRTVAFSRRRFPNNTTILNHLEKRANEKLERFSVK